MASVMACEGTAPRPTNGPAAPPEFARRRRRHFLLRLVVGCLAPLVAAVVCQATYTVMTQRRMVRQALADKASSLAALMVNVAGPNMVFEDRKAVGEALGFAAADPDFQYALARDAQGNLVASRGLDGARVAAVARAASPSSAHVEVRPDVVVAAQPVRSDGTFIGIVEVGLRTDHAASQVRQLSMVAALISLAGVAAAILVVFALARRIARRNRDMKMLLDTVEQGFLGMDAEGTLAPERSAVAAAWLGPYQPRQKLWDAVATVDARAAGWLRMGWENLRDSNMPVEICLDQLPKRITIGHRTVRLEVRPLMLGDQLQQALVVLSDITAELERQRAEAMGHDVVGILERLAQDKAGLFEFVEDAETLIADVERGLGALSGGDAGEALLRDLHTLKGNTATFGLSHIARCCHELEERLAAGVADGLDAGAPLLSSWRALHGKLRHILGVGHADLIELRAQDLDAIESRLRDGAPAAELLDLVGAWRLEPVEVRLERWAVQAREIARRLGRGEIRVDVDTDGVRLKRERWSPFWRIFGHVLRNAVDHGLETPADREAAGKPPLGTLRLRARLIDRRLVIEVEDDGRGIAWDHVAAKARALGLPASRPDDLVSALFADGLTTKREASELSGRGVGLAAVRAACHKLGGDVTVTSSAGKGTTMRFTWPIEGSSPTVAHNGRRTAA